MLVIPVPLQTPPGSTADKVKAEAFSQNGPAGVMVASHEVGRQGSKLEIPLIVITFPKESVTLRVSIPGGGVMVEPVPIVVQLPGVLQVVTGKAPSKQEPKNQVYPQF